jgi:8-oxo-dGTP pyrophosphatase MutT (NUDIX family)
MIGSDLLLLPSVAVIPKDADGRLLLVRHADTGTWGLIGGTIEVDERPDVAAVRETLEETGATVEIGALLGVFGGPEYHVHYANGDHTAYVVTAYAARIVSGDLRPDLDEVTELGWFAPSDIGSGLVNQLAFALLRDAHVLN